MGISFIPLTTHGSMSVFLSRVFLACLKAGVVRGGVRLPNGEEMPEPTKARLVQEAKVELAAAFERGLAHIVEWLVIGCWTV